MAKPAKSHLIFAKNWKNKYLFYLRLNDCLINIEFLDIIFIEIEFHEYTCYWRGRKRTCFVLEIKSE